VVFLRELVVFAERIAFPVVGAEDAEQVRVAGEVDAHEVVGFALVPVGNGPDVRDGRHLWKLAGLIVFPAGGEQRLDDGAVLELEAVEVIDDFDMRLVGELRGQLGIGFEEVGGAQIVERVERQFRVRLQERSHLGHGSGGHLDPRIGGLLIKARDLAGSEPVDQSLVDLLDGHEGIVEG
jgi:hypothetical protein